MLLLRNMLFLAAAVMVMTNAQCVATCAAADCGQPASQSHDPVKRPPCHPRHAPKQSTAVKPCVDSVVVVEGRSLRPSPEGRSIEPLAAISAPGAARLLPVMGAHWSPAASPPIFVARSFTLNLRI